MQVVKTIEATEGMTVGFATESDRIICQPFEDGQAAPVPGVRVLVYDGTAIEYRGRRVTLSKGALHWKGAAKVMKVSLYDIVPEARMKVIALPTYATSLAIW